MKNTQNQTQVSSQRPNETDLGYSRRISETTHTHTPGPWHVNPRGFIVQSTGDIITRLECSNNNDNDARLIASAPELLEALEDAAFLMRMAAKIAGPMQDSFKRSAEDAAKAIAKAEGNA
jgi:hypothetical protein